MPTFAYQARNKQGERVQGKHEAPDKRTALLALREAELFVTQLNPLTAEKAAVGASSGKAEEASIWWWRAKPKEMSLYFRQMYAMIHGGTSLASALATLGTSAPSKHLRQASQEMSRNVGKGKMWSEEMRRYPGLFSPLMLAMIHSGEVGGFLDKSCSKLADYSEQDQHVSQVITRETWYPKLVVFCSALLYFGLPPVISIINKTPPRVAFLHFLASIALPFLAFFCVWMALNMQKFFTPLARHLKPVVFIADQTKLLTPYFCITVRKLAVAKFCRTFAALNTAGISVDSSFSLAADACGNAAIGERIKRVIPQVQSGKGITASLASTRQFPPIVLQMLQTGEVSGDFEEQLESVATFLEQESETSIQKSMKVLGVIALFLVGILVLMQLVQFYTGYYNNMFDQVDKMQ